MRSLIAALVLVPSLAIAQPRPPDNMEMSLGVSDPTGACTVGRCYTNTTTGHLWWCYGGTWHDVAATAGTSYPLLAPAGTDLAKSYSFTGEPTFGMTMPATNTMRVGSSSTWTDHAYLQVYEDGGSNLEEVFLYAENDAYGVRISMGCHTAGSGSDDPNYCTIGSGGPPATSGVRWQRESFFPIVEDAYDLGADDNDTTPNLAQWRYVRTARGVQGCKTKALTESTATGFAVVSVPTIAPNNYAAGEVVWAVQASDATDIQTLSGRTAFNCVNKSGTETCAALVSALTTAVAASAGAGKDDLACTFDATTTPSDGVLLRANCATTEMTQTSLNICYRFDMPKRNLISPQ